ncbi:unnamed protein product [Caenorhabditis angaria]|uniref:Uncharacterized protein n=1 Tax=Caenorhabditis angaria TaxID=860376 RepID=A0A9P1I8D8_9PELO|nr:unnamed protein product [Caenorhabditis angaria]
MNVLHSISLYLKDRSILQRIYKVDGYLMETVSYISTYVNNFGILLQLADISATVREKRQNSYTSSSSCSLNNTSKHDGHKLVELELQLNSISLKTHEEIEPKTPTLDEELPLLTEDKEEDAKTEEIIAQPTFYDELMNPEIKDCCRKDGEEKEEELAKFEEEEEEYI